MEPDFVLVATCRGCGKPIVCAAEVEDGELVVMSSGRMPSDCPSPREGATPKCGDRFPADIRTVYAPPRQLTDDEQAAVEKARQWAAAEFGERRRNTRV